MNAGIDTRNANTGRGRQRLKSLAGFSFAVVLILIAVFMLGGNDKAAILNLFNDYYTALRNGQFGRAASCYEPGALDALGMDPAEALKAAYGIGPPLAENPALEALRIQGKQATGEVVLSREGLGPYRLVMEDERGNRVGTWAKTIHFVKIDGAWKISKDSTNSANIDMNQALDLLTKIQRARGIAPPATKAATAPD